ncbi:MAG TPA: glutathione S-transferase family protein [Acetobacteraceae bacterium]|nr:glutathione S-transferase family protein [Acetobacteraceae bacterium]
MQLFHVPGSPYARMVRIAVAETGLGARVAQAETTLRDPASTLLPLNPVGRVPTLVLEDGTVLTETLPILLHLDTLHDGPRLVPVGDAARMAAYGRAMGMMDGVAVWNRELRRPEHERSPSVIALETTRANRVADALERDAARGALDQRLDAAWLALACALGYCERRHRAWRWREGRPALSAWFDAAARRPGFADTTPPESGI